MHSCSHQPMPCDPLQELGMLKLLQYCHLQVIIHQPELRKQNVRCPLPFGHALLNDSNNVEWHASLAPETEAELKLVYSVEYPLQDDVLGLPKS